MKNHYLVLGKITLQQNNEWERTYITTARHKLVLHDCRLEDLVDEIIEASKNDTVLVVCNRVEQAKEFYKILKEHVHNIGLIHGGFNQRDRNRKEQELFSKENPLYPT